MGLVVHLECEEPPASFRWANAPCVQEIGDFIVRKFKLGAVVAFVDVLVEVLHRPNRSAHLDVTVRLEHRDQVWGCTAPPSDYLAARRSSYGSSRSHLYDT